MFYFVKPTEECMSRCTDRFPVSVVVEDCFLTGWLSLMKRDNYEVQAVPVDAFRFDLGGAVFMDEPEIALEVPGLTLRTLVRHAEFLLQSCHRIQMHLPELGEHVFLQGRWCKAIVSNETAKQIMEQLQPVISQIISSSDQTDAELSEKLRSTGVLLVRK